jgi:hypothetical protein
MAQPLSQVPAWVLRPLPANAATDANLHHQLQALAAALPNSLSQMVSLLEQVRYRNTYDAAVNDVCRLVHVALPQFFVASAIQARLALLRFAREHCTEQARNRIIRRLTKDRSLSVRRAAQRMVARTALHEVALPADDNGAWDESGWLHGIAHVDLTRHATGQAVQAATGVPVLRDLAALRALLHIQSPRQLGYFLLASDANHGPYTRFTIPKKNGKAREICAPKAQLCWVQRRILDEILAKVAPHHAAHGFVAGRSTVTNATPHLGAALLVKFDLTDFFPTIHYYRVLGLFARLGYPVGDARFTTDDDSKKLAPVLARLCCHTPDPNVWGEARLPQGAPTSPALSNLVCRRMDARLTGLARRNAAVYTRYADDLTFSFKNADGINLGRFRWWVNQICHQEGFFINEAKFRVIRAAQRQMVTGLVVNEVLRVPRDERRAFRAILHNCRKHGVEAQARGNPKFTQYLRGFASYVNMVHPDEGAEFLAQVTALLGPDPGDEHA